MENAPLGQGGFFAAFWACFRGLFEGASVSAPANDRDRWQRFTRLLPNVQHASDEPVPGNTPREHHDQ